MSAGRRSRKPRLASRTGDQPAFPMVSFNLVFGPSFRQPLRLPSYHVWLAPMQVPVLNRDSTPHNSNRHLLLMDHHHQEEKRTWLRGVRLPGQSSRPLRALRGVPGFACGYAVTGFGLSPRSRTKPGAGGGSRGRMTIRSEDFESFNFNNIGNNPQRPTTSCNTKTTAHSEPWKTLGCWFLLWGFARYWERVSHECPTKSRF
jgi:hypothetical protein